MIWNHERFLTTHTGSLPRPRRLTELVFTQQEGGEVDSTRYRQAVDDAVRDVVRRQRTLGIDIVSDGEMSKPGFVNYIGERLAGFGGLGTPWQVTDLADLPDLLESLYGGPGGTHIRMPRCEGEIRYRGEELVERDVANLRRALEGDEEAMGFLPAASPGCIAMCAEDVHYGSYERYLEAVAEAMREEYRAIVEAGFVLQLDCPDLPMMPHTTSWASPIFKEWGYARFLQLQLNALDAAVAEFPPDRVRIHLCWGNYAGPHTHDIPLGDVLGAVLQTRPGAISFEAANPQHEHEWETLSELSIPEDKLLIPGVIDTKTNVVEHPRLVAQRIERFARVVGRERVVPGTDCGFATFVGFGLVEPDVAWMKLEALVEGAALATNRLWARS